MPEIKQRPILFSAPMVRAILEGRKTVTRRAVKATKAHADGFMMLDHGNGWWPYNAFGDFTSDHEGVEYPIACPYGKLGDRLWVRETFACGLCTDQPYAYRATHAPEDLEAGWHDPIKWKPSIHMPRVACRILLEITDVRVERLQDITYEQAAAEGVHRGPLREWCASDEGGSCHKYPVPAFRDLWQSVGGNWDANPWVWVVEFKQVTP